MAERYETVIVGGGHAGLMSYHLSRRGCLHVVLERGRVASLTLPGQSCAGDDSEAPGRAG